MKLRRRPLLAPALLLLSLSAAAGAQVATQVPPQVRRGMLSNTPVGLLIQSSPDALWIADPGQSGAPPAPWSTARFGVAGQNYPAYTLESIFGSLAPCVVLTGISTGNDWMPQFHPDGKMNMTAETLWFGLTVSVTNASDGVPGSHVERVSAGGDSPGAELFTYYAAGSVGIAPSLPNTTLSERSRESLGLAYAPGTPPLERPDVGDIDYGLGVIPFDPNQQAGPMFSCRNRLYFTLAVECVDALGDEFAVQMSGGVSTLVPADSATIYVARWDIGPSGYEWKQPEVYRSAAELDLSDDTDQIDAIAVCQQTGRVIFSTEPVPGRNQLLVYQPGQVEPPQAVKAANGVEVTVHLGLTESSDVDGTCGIDPEQVYSYSGALGIPELSWVAPGEEPLGISLARAQPGHVGADLIHVHVTGALEDGVTGILALCVTEKQIALLGSPFTTSGWLLAGTQPYAPGQLEASWTFPGPSVSVPLEAALVACLLKQTDDGVGPARSSWVSILKLQP